ncbi:MAG: TetR/AcrR family transcriptional regulator [Pseudomonadota bacterium]
MPRPALTDEQKRETRNKIRAAAAHIYREHGATDISVRAVAAEAGVSVGTVYSYFENLAELLQSLWRAPVRALISEMDTLAADHDDPHRRLEALMGAYLNFAQAQDTVFRNAFLFVRPEGISPPPQVDLQRDRFFKIYQQTIEDGQVAGVFRAGDPAELVQLVLSALHGSISLPINLHRLALDASGAVPNQMIAAMLEWLGNVNAD